MKEHDLETHARLLNAAAELFAARGFKDVTVREICRAAGANVAAVNYHFGGKLGLYRDVLNAAIDTMRATTEAARQAGAGRSPEERLRAYIRVFVRRVGSECYDSWIHRLMAREIADPTPALELIAAQVVAPRLNYLAEALAEILDCSPDDEVVLRCVLSIQSQCHAAMPHAIARRYSGLFVQVPADNAALDRLAEHIADFSLAGIAQIRKVHGVHQVQGVHNVQKVHEVPEVHEVQSVRVHTRRTS